MYVCMCVRAWVHTYCMRAGVCVRLCIPTVFKFERALSMTDRCDSVTVLQAPADNPCFLPLIKVLCSINLTPAAVPHHSTLKSSLK